MGNRFKLLNWLKVQWRITIYHENKLYFNLKYIEQLLLIEWATTTKIQINALKLYRMIQFKKENIVWCGIWFICFSSTIFIIANFSFHCFHDIRFGIDFSQVGNHDLKTNFIKYHFNGFVSTYDKGYVLVEKMFWSRLPHKAHQCHIDGSNSNHCEPKNHQKLVANHLLQLKYWNYFIFII